MDLLVAHRHYERRKAVRRLGVDVGVALHQQIHHVGESLFHRQVEWRPSAFTVLIYIGSTYKLFIEDQCTTVILDCLLSFVIKPIHV